MNSDCLRTFSRTTFKELLLHIGKIAKLPSVTYNRQLRVTCDCYLEESCIKAFDMVSGKH
jgi:hypothetical protein